MKYTTMLERTHDYTRVNAFITKLQTSSVPARLFLFFLSGSRAASTYVPETAFGQIFANAHPVGVVIIIVAIAGLLDTLVNDVLPDKYHLGFTLSVRHAALMMCSGFFALAVYLTVDTGFSWVLIPECAACALTIAVHAFFDLRRRFKWGV